LDRRAARRCAGKASPGREIDSAPRELATSIALGATRARLVRQTLTESLVLAAAGGVGGALLAIWAVPALIASAPPEVPRLQDVGVVFVRGLTIPGDPRDLGTIRVDAVSPGYFEALGVRLLRPV
jgi:predicted lysophospholipase L1 biosynthesis ABC-type transport system permease subunit